MLGFFARRRYGGALDRATAQLASGDDRGAAATLEAALADGVKGWGEGAPELAVLHYAAASAAMAAGELTRAEGHLAAGLALRDEPSGDLEPPRRKFLELSAALAERRAPEVGPAPDLVAALRTWAEACGAAGDREAVAAAQNRLGLALARGGEREAAAEAFRASLAVRRASGSKAHRSALETTYNLATLRPPGAALDTSALEKAGRELDEVVAGTRDADDEAGRALHEAALHNLAVVREDEGRVGEARDLYERALRLREARLGDRDASLRPTLARLARLHHREGRIVHALSLYERAIAIAAGELGPDDPVVLGLERWRRALTEGEGDA